MENAVHRINMILYVYIYIYNVIVIIGKSMYPLRIMVFIKFENHNKCNYNCSGLKNLYDCSRKSVFK